VEQLLHPDQALAQILEATPAPAITRLTLDQALDHVLAQDVSSSEDVPVADISAMDGFAVRSADVAGATHEKPVRLAIVDYIPAGKAPGRGIGAGEAIRIMTGGTVPEGADAVVKQEDTSGAEAASATTVSIQAGAALGEHIFKKGEDIRRGDVLVKAGARLRPQELGVLGSVGAWTIPVFRPPRVAVLTSGDELIEPKDAMAPGKVRSSNTLTLLGQVRRYGGVPQDLGIARDTLEDMTNRLNASRDADIVITSGGSARGDKDFTEEAFLKQGARILFHRVAIKPGKPVLFGTRERTLYFGLPGNPVASMLTFELFVRPALLKLRGFRQFAKGQRTGILQEDVVKREKGKRHFIRVRYEEDAGGGRVHTTGSQGSSVLTSMTRANALLIMDMDETRAERGSAVTVTLLDEDLLG
jgi:molybdopterin molybdotransferase